ncbi:hypothetical protein FM076_28640 [Streptomyces albus subsp. chlorinus]|uniref:hypothetical protein n=1 Tax=Streptomyces albus TaxID=1888 RepID=UPI00156D6936|nr:hypothetical protein [Streptomyces albus]NSC24913.1 hypothetical protein [Streptomyces albus subsp. chlorinus]
MRTKPTLAVAAALLALTALTGCDGDAGSKTASTAPPEKRQRPDDGGQRPDDGRGEREDAGGGGSLSGLPHAGTLRGVETYLGKTQLPCYDMSSEETDDRLPADGFVDRVPEDASPAEKRQAAAWSIEEKGVCGEDWTNSYMVYMTKDMAAFQRRYKAYVMDNARSSDSSSLTSGRFLVGADFAVDPVGKIRDSGLLSTELLLLNCDPDLKVPSGYTKRPSLVKGCVLTDYVAT